MKLHITKKIVAVLSGLIGIFFLLNSASDIQLGFGLVLIITGILGYPQIPVVSGFDR